MNGNEHLQLISTLIEFQTSYCNIDISKDIYSSPPLYELALASGSIEICKYISSTCNNIINLKTTLPHFIYLFYSRSTTLIDEIIIHHRDQYLSDSTEAKEFELKKRENKSLIIIELLSAISELLSPVQQLTQHNNNRPQIQSTIISLFQSDFVKQLSHIYDTYLPSIINPLQCRFYSNQTILHLLITYVYPSQSIPIIRAFIRSSHFNNDGIPKATKSAFLYAKPTNGERILDIVIKMGTHSSYELFVDLYSYTTDLTIDFDNSPNYSTLLHHASALKPTSILSELILNSQQFTSLSVEQQNKYIVHQNHNDKTAIEVAIEFSNTIAFKLLWAQVTPFYINQYHSTLFPTIASSNLNKDDFTFFIQTIINGPQFKSFQPIQQSQLLHYPNSNNQTVFDILIQNQQFKSFEELVTLI